MSDADGLLAHLGPDEIRAAVRAVLREVLPAGVVPDVAQPSGGTRTGAHEGLPGHGEVVVASDADLTALLRRVAALCEDPRQRAALQEGRHDFRLVRTDGAPAGPGPAGTGTGRTGARVTRVDRGAVTERVVKKAAAEGTRLLLGPGAVLTPLARDKARALGIEIEKER